MLVVKDNLSRRFVPRLVRPVDTPACLKYCQADNLSVSTLLNVVLADDPEDEKIGIDGDLWHTS